MLSKQHCQLLLSALPLSRAGCSRCSGALWADSQIIWMVSSSETEASRNDLINFGSASGVTVNNRAASLACGQSEAMATCANDSVIGAAQSRVARSAPDICFSFRIFRESLHMPIDAQEAGCCTCTNSGTFTHGASYMLFAHNL